MAERVIFIRIKALYEQGKVTDAMLESYVKKGILTQKEADLIRGE